MRKLTALIAVWSSLAAAACAERPGVSFDEARDLLDRSQDRWLEAQAARDAEGMAALFSDDAVMHVANMPPIEGRDAIHRFYENLFGFLAASEAVAETTRVSRGGDLAYTVGRTTNTFEGPEGRVEYSGKFVLVWSKPADEWLTAVYSVSSDEAQGGR